MYGCDQGLQKDNEIVSILFCFPVITHMHVSYAHFIIIDVIKNDNGKFYTVNFTCRFYE